LVLADGGNERLGRAKAFFEINGKPMIQHLARNVSKLSEEIAISCRFGREKLTRMFPRVKVVVDRDGRKGALTDLVSSPEDIELLSAEDFE